MSNDRSSTLIQMWTTYANLLWACMDDLYRRAYIIYIYIYLVNIWSSHIHIH
jgi:hypothetical protein